MEVIEQTKRNCCNPQKDFKTYNGKIMGDSRNLVTIYKIHFCVHCGQVWRHITREDFHGGPYWTKVCLDTADFIDKITLKWKRE